MAVPPKHEYRDYTDEYDEHVPLESYGESDYTSYENDDAQELLLSSSRRHGRRGALLKKLYTWLNRHKLYRNPARLIKRVKRKQAITRCSARRLLSLLYFFLGSLLALVVIVGLFFPSYTVLPPHYRALRDRIRESSEAGVANIRNEKVFIAASIYDPDSSLAGGDWAKNVLRLIHILGPHNVYLSIYENDSGPLALEALSRLEVSVPCNHTLISEAHLDLNELPHVSLADGSQRTKRIAYLAEVRNRALRPLEVATVRFDKLLYLNDVMFDPIDAAQLLFSTHIDPDGVSQYRAACAVDFINPFKFYDTFATRDLDGFSMGVPFFPWFSAVGRDVTLDAILSDDDAVQVRSCWGGMVAFDARFFQDWAGEGARIPTAGNESPSNISAPYRFRAESDLWWDASECCLIQADIQNPDPLRSEIYMNPFVRVAYDTRTLSWLWLLRRFEKLYTPIHFVADILVSLPDFNPRRDEKPWQEVDEIVWVSDGSDSGRGSWQKVARTAKHDGFCGRRKLQVMKLSHQEGEKNWEVFEPPPLMVDK